MTPLLAIPIVTAVAATGSAPTGADLLAAAEVRFEFDPAATTPRSPQETAPAPKDLPAPVPAFGARGSWRLHVHGGYGADLSNRDNRLALGGVGLSHFLADGFSIDVELNGIDFRQEGPNAAAFNPNLLFRWHFHMEPEWSLFLDGGAGLLFGSDDVPSHGSGFNFTPQAGVGGTLDLGGDVRLMVGARWHHVSNANLSRDNPGRDSVMGYLGLSIPF